ncbi:hypothetical protein OH76DRAFT_1324153, partial [Lentinus brumalis]
LMTDRHGSLIASALRVFPLTRHLYCLHHLKGNIAQHIQGSLQASWADFTQDFWKAYRAVSPDEFDRLWNELVVRYPTASSYLQEEIYPCRDRWAWAWVGTVFTAGSRTSGRVEVENRVTGVLGGTKKSFSQVFDALNARTLEQSCNDMISVRQSSRRQHPNANLENLFKTVLEQVRKYAGPYALQTVYQQMERSVYYKTEVVLPPQGVKDWGNFNNFDNDSAYVSTAWLIWLIRNRNMSVQHLLKVTHGSTGAVHYIAVIDAYQHVCDCCMGLSLGIPCRHFFQALSASRGKSLLFHMGLIR